MPRKTFLKGPAYKNKQGDFISYLKIINALFIETLIIYFGFITKIWRKAQYLNVHNCYHSIQSLFFIKHRPHFLLLWIFYYEDVFQLFGNISFSISALILKEGISDVKISYWYNLVLLLNQNNLEMQCLKNPKSSQLSQSRLGELQALQALDASSQPSLITQQDLPCHGLHRIFPLLKGFAWQGGELQPFRDLSLCLCVHVHHFLSE